MGGFIYPSTVTAELARLSAALLGTDQSVQSCPALDDATRASWGSFYAEATLFTQQDPGIFGSGTAMDRAQSYETELAKWQVLLSKTCTLTLPIFDPNAGGLNTSSINTALQYIMWTAVAVGGAYVVGKVVSIVPRRRD